MERPEVMLAYNRRRLLCSLSVSSMIARVNLPSGQPWRDRK